MAVAAEHTSIYIEQAESQQDVSQQEHSPFNINFVFDLILPKLVEKYRNQPEKLKEKNVRRDLIALLRSQYSDILRELLNTRIYDQHYLEFRIDDAGNVSLWHPLYPHGDILKQCELGAERAITQARKNRYEKEKLQVETLLAMVHDGIAETPYAVLEVLAHEPPPEHWVPYTGTLPAEFEQYRPVGNTNQPLVGEKLFFILPKNNIYPDGTSFWATWQPAYIPWLPAEKRYVVLINQYLNTFSNDQHRGVIEQLTSRPQSTTSSNESALMQNVFVLPQEYQSLDGMQTFSLLLSSLIGEEFVADMLTQNQTALGEFGDREHAIQPASEFVADVMLDEYRRSQTLRDHDDSRGHVLDAQHDIVMNTLIQGMPFDKKVAGETYLKIYNPRIRSTHMSNQQQAQLQQSFVAELAETPSMWHVINRVSSVGQCSLGSFGGLTRFTEMANSASFMQGLGLPSVGSTELFTAIKDRGHVFTKDQIAQLIGKERFDQNFKQGTCVACENTDFVGECGVCWRCELTWEKNNFADDSRTTTGAGAFSDPDTTGYSGRVGASELIQSTLLPLNRVMSSFSSIS